MVSSAFNKAKKNRTVTMDVVSAASSIITILAVIRKTIKYIEEIREFPSKCERLLTELRSTEIVLSDLETLSSDSRTDSTRRDAIRDLNQPDGPLASFRSKVEHFSSRIQSLLSRRKAGVVLLWPLRETEIMDFVASLERQKTLCSLAIAGNHVALSQELKNTFSTVGNSVKRMEHLLDQEHGTEILHWLSPEQLSEKHQDINARHTDGTGQWFLNRDELRSWLEDQASNPILWCRGHPGAGKTDLFSLLVNVLKEQAVESETGITYFYCDYREAQIQSSSYILSALLRQLAASKHSIPPAIQDFFLKFGKKRERPKLVDLKAVFRRVLEDYRGTFVLIDALDECDIRTRQQILQVFKDLASDLKQIKILFTSRPHLDDITKIMGSIPYIEIEANAQDIKTFVVQSIEKTDTVMEFMNDELKNEIVEVLLERSRGIFLLPALQIQSILEKTTRSEIRQAIATMSEDLHDTFKEMMDRLQSQGSSRANLSRRALMWISNASRTLRVQELCQALAIKANDPSLDEDNLPLAKHIVQFCVGLVVIDGKSSEIRLMHSSLQEYLRDHQKDLFAGAHETLASICLTALTFGVAADEDVETGSRIRNLGASFQCIPLLRDVTIDAESARKDVETRLNKLPFLRYAAMHWGDHERESTNSSNHTLAFRFLNSQRCLKSACQIDGYENSYLINQTWKYAPQETREALHTLAFFGLHDLTTAYLQKDPSRINHKDSRGNSALTIAAREGHLDCMKVLDEFGADIQSSKSSRMGIPRTPLVVAASRGNDSVVEWLINKQFGNQRIYECADPITRASAVLASAEASLSKHDSTIAILKNAGCDLISESPDDSLLTQQVKQIVLRGWGIYQEYRTPLEQDILREI